MKPKKKSKQAMRLDRELQLSFSDWKGKAQREIDKVGAEVAKINKLAQEFFEAKVLQFKKVIGELIADADGKLRAALSSALQEEVLPALSTRAIHTMMSKEWMDAVIEKASASVLRKTQTDIDKAWTQKTEEMKNLAPTIFTEYIKSPDFITKVVAQVNALQLRKD